MLVTGATGFVGRALLDALVAEGYLVRAVSRRAPRAANTAQVEWLECDINQRPDLSRALAGVDVAFFLVHAMGSGTVDYAQAELRLAAEFRDAAARAGLRRIVYLGGVAPAAEPSDHLKSRLAVGTLLRSGTVPALELRASMIIGNGSASWQIVRDLALRLPAMLLPAWTASRTCPIALEDVIAALVRALVVPLPQSAWYDIPGPDTLSGREILSSIARLRGRRMPGVTMPFLSVSLSSWWLKLVTRTKFSLARELVLGFKTDLLPTDARYWLESNYQPRWTFEAAARKALAEERLAPGLTGAAGRLAEAFIQLISPKLDD